MDDSSSAQETSASVLEADNNSLWDQLHSKTEVLRGVCRRMACAPTLTLLCIVPDPAALHSTCKAP